MNNELRKMVIDKLRKGEDLPVEWAREIFPPEKREYELVYYGKEREEEILSETMAVPLQPVRMYGKNGEDWHNLLIFGDNLQALKRLLDDKESGKLCNSDGTPGVRLIYIDPPFSTKQEFRGTQDQKAYQDKIAGAQFLEFLRRRLIFLRELLSDDGAIFVHLDYRKKHYIKALMDETFGENNFRNEIAVNRIKKNIRERERVKKLNEEFDTILFYSKNDSLLVLPPTREDIKPDRWHAFDAAGFRKGMDYNIFGHKPAINRHWHWSRDKAFKAKENYATWEKKYSKKESLGDYWKRTGNSLQFVRSNINTGKPEYFIPASEESLCNNLWNDISAYSFSYNYPTEKSENLLERIINMASKKGDIILDCFAGSGTTLAVAEKLNRRWIGIDCGKLSIYTIQKRLLNVIGSNSLNGDNKKHDKEYSPFILYNAGLYDFSSLKDLKWEDWRFFALQLFSCKDEVHSIGGLKLDGKLKGASVLVFDHQRNPNKRIDEDTIKDIHNAVGKKISSRFFIIAPRGTFDFQQDYIDFEGIRYYALRIPYSVINELHKREFKALQQPNDENAVNDIVEAWGFDFIRPPKVEWRAGADKEAFIKIKNFQCHARIKGEDTEQDINSFSMLMIDFDYNGDIFDLDAVYYAHKLKENKWEARFPIAKVGKNVMVVFIDIHGNEAREVISRSKFGLPMRKRKR